MTEALSFADPPFDGTVSGVLCDRRQRDPEHVLLEWEGRHITTADISSAAQAYAKMLRRRNVGPGDIVLTMLDAGPNYVAMFFAVSFVGAIWVPQSPDAKGPSLEHVLAVAQPSLIIAAPRAIANLRAAGGGDEARTVELEGWAWSPFPEAEGLENIASADADEVRAVLFTSGTTGPPKGVLVTDRMMLASAAGCAVASKCKVDDVFLMWEPMHHIGGPQLLIMALIHGARLVLVERFSASRFWPVVLSSGVTKLHYLGGILEILLKSPTRSGEKDHPIKLAFGGGSRPEVRREFNRRFSIPIREVFGMTEASSFTTVDERETEASIGQVLPWMEVELVGEDGQPVADDAFGEMIVRPRHAGLLTPGYLGDTEATAKTLRGEWLHTGDLARRDGDGNYFFVGRKTDSLRRRGENISAWEVETALARHPEIAETAVVGVPARVGESEILCFVLMRDGYAFDPAAISRWCRANLPKHHVPRYWKCVDGFERTPSLRIRKDRLDTGLTDAIDLEVN